LTEVDANGVETRFQYDARGHLLSRTVDGAETRMEYDARGLLIATAFADGSTQHYGYDAAQRLVRVTNGTGTTVEYSLDALGNRIEERYLDSAGATVSRQARIYNRQNQLEQLIGGAGQTTTFAYDDNGRLQTIGDPRGGGLSAQREYDSLGRETASTDNLGAVTRTQYDHQDQVVAVTDRADSSPPTAATAWVMHSRPSAPMPAAAATNTMPPAIEFATSINRNPASISRSATSSTRSIV
jgi:YD repeat-containing protein